RADDTAIIFASDHGDLLGDFNLISKHVFFGPAAHVPLIVHLPNTSAPQVVSRTVSLTDLYATILALAGQTPRRDNDSIQLGDAREYLFGATELGFVIRSDEWKLCRYKNGMTALFDLKNDPTEQHNRAYDAVAIGVLKELDALLQKEITESILFGQSDKFVEESRYQGRGEFGTRGWARRYPASIAEKN
ncbi:MAG: sulfatase-like hydrolase/transferase, partial [Chloroflexi bacterium]|nr:sulfatase-like hydrolase/transferase [Chloroflexota bacterium]